MVKKQFIILLLLSIAAIQPAFALSKLEASVDRNPVMEGEYFVLNISADDQIDTGELDTSALLKDFVVGRTSVSRSTQIINFDSAKETRWQVLLSPKRQGQLTIPAFTLKNVSSAPIQVNVVPVGTQPAEAKNLFIDAKLSTDEAYIGQLITYKVKLYLAVELQRGVLSAPVVEGAQVKQIGEDKDGTEIVDGRRFRVIERTYSIIPDIPGRIDIQGASFAGDVLVESQRRGGMFGFNESRPMQASAPAQSVSINPAPNSFQGQWLVADLVVLKETFPEETAEFTVGSPITRTITLLASNTDENSLPDIVQPLPEDIKLYPEKPQRQTFVRDAQIVSQYSITAAIVPTKAGTYTLPEITVPWWNPHLKRQETATLPARTITVVGGAAPETTQSNTWQHSETQTNYWPWVSLVFALLWLVTLVAWRRAIKNTSLAPIVVQANTTKAPKHGLAALEHACQKGDTSQVIQQLQGYFSEIYQVPMTLDKIAALSEPLKLAITNLQAKAYQSASEKDTLNLQSEYLALLHAVKLCQSNPKKNKTTGLVPLNPT